MKLCILADASAYHTHRWIDYFVERGWEVHLISLEKPILKSRGIEHIIAPRITARPFKYLTMIPEIKNCLRKIRPDVVNAHYVPNYGFVCSLLGIHPLAISAWGSDILISAERSPLHRLRTRWALRPADLVTADSENLARALHNLEVPREKILIVPMGVDLFQWKMRTVFKKPSVQILSYRQLEPIYQVELLVRAIPEIIRVVKKDLRFVIAGTGSQKEYLRALASQLGVQPNLRFTGTLTPMALTKLVYESDIYVSTALSDTTSVSLLEAMAAGLFPVASDIPGNREWIEHGKNGFLFSARDKNDLAARIINAATNRLLWHKSALLNRSIIEKRASWQQNMMSIERRFLNLQTS